MSFTVERKENKIYIKYESIYNDFYNEIEPVVMYAEVEAGKFEECVKKLAGVGIINPELLAMVKFVFYGDCIEY
jgi:hypothetical protein